MAANYDYEINQWESTRTNPALVAGAGNATAIAFIEGATADDDLLGFFIGGGGGTAVRLVRRGSDTFAEGGTLNTDFWNLSNTNSTASSSPANTLVFDKHPSTPASDLLIIQLATLIIVNRGGTSTPFPGASTVNNINKWETTNANIGGQIQSSAGCIAYHPSNRDDDWYVLPSENITTAVQLLRRTSSGVFPGSASEGTDRISLSKANAAGGNANHQCAVFAKHPTDSAKDLLIFGNRTSSSLDLVPRGATSTPFPGGTLGTGRYNVSQSVGKFDGISKYITINYHPTNLEKDLLIVNNTGNNTFSLLSRGDDDTAPFSLLLGVITYADCGMTSANGLCIGVGSSRVNDILFISSRLMGRVFYFNSWKLSSRVVVTELFKSIIGPTSPVLLNANDITIDASVDVFNLDRIVTTLAVPLDSNIVWTRTTETDFTLDGGFIFSGATAAITGNYLITMAANTTVTLGNKAVYSDTITVPSTGTLVLTASTELTDDFILSAGTTIEADDDTGPYTLTIPYPDPGLVTGPGITIAAPQVTTTLTNLVEGSKIRVFVAGTTNEIAGTTAVSGTTFAFVTSLSFDVRIFKNGFRAFSLLSSPAPTNNQDIQINQLIDRAYNDP